jgi:hypothetical protein
MTPRWAVAAAQSRGHVVRGRAGMGVYSALAKVIYATTPAKTPAGRGTRMGRHVVGLRLDIEQRTLSMHLDGSHRVVMVAPGDEGHGWRTGGLVSSPLQ